MKYLSLFTGVGGFENGIQALETQSKDSTNDTGGTPQHSVSPLCIGFSEIDKYANQVLKYRFPNIKQYGDITTITTAELPDFDLLVGGFPCQSFSIAGKRKGFEDTRGTLFFEIARILTDKRPRHILLENVKGLLSHDSGKTFQRILEVLTDIGYRVQWQVLNSKDYGVPQNRERVFIVGCLGDGCRRKVFPIGQGSGETKGKHQTKDIQNWQQTGTNENNKDYAICLTAQQREGSRMANHIGIKQLNQPKHSNDRVYSDEGLSPTINTAQGGNRQPFIANTLDANYHKGNSATKERHTPRTEVEQDTRIRRLTPTECERLQGFPDGWTKYGINEKGEKAEMSDTQRYKMMGNAVTTNVIQAVIEAMF